MTLQKGENARLRCNNCGGDRDHVVLEGHVITYNSDEYHGQQGYFICRCLGCREISFIDEDIDYESNVFDGERGEVIEFPRRLYYPPRMARQEPEWVSRLEPAVANILMETYRALHNESPMLAVMGVRAALEILMIKLVGDNGSFAKNVDKFIDAGYVAKNVKDAIMSTLDVGSAAIHRGYTPDLTVLNDVFEVVEGIFVSTLLPSYGARIKKKTPPKPLKGPKQP